MTRRRDGFRDSPPRLLLPDEGAEVGITCAAPVPGPFPPGAPDVVDRDEAVRRCLCMRDERDGLRPNEGWRSRFSRLGSLGSLWRTLCWRGPGPGLGSVESAALFPLMLALAWLVLVLVSSAAVIGKSSTAVDDDASGGGGIDDGGGCPFCPCACACCSCTPDGEEAVNAPGWSPAGIGIGLGSPPLTAAAATAPELVPGRDLPNEGLFRGDLGDLLVGTGGGAPSPGGDEGPGSVMEESLPLLFLLFPPSLPKSDEKKGVACVVGLVRCMSHTLFC